MTATETIAGILIGGQSRRMGTSKALLRFRETTFIEHLVQVARAVAEEVVLLGNAQLNIPALGGVPQLADEPGFAGPLAGLVPLLDYADNRRALLVACDMPLLDSEILTRMLSACEQSVDASVFRIADDQGFFPCCAAFHPRIVSEARMELARSASLQALIARLRCRALEVDVAEAHKLRSFNSPDEYADLMRSDHELAAGVHVG